MSPFYFLFLVSFVALGVHTPKQKVTEMYLRPCHLFLGQWPITVLPWCFAAENDYTRQSRKKNTELSRHPYHYGTSTSY